MNLKAPNSDYILFSIVILLIPFLGCQKETLTVTLPTDNVILGNLSVGQKSLFQRFTYNIYDAQSPARQFREDTLVVEVMSAVGERMLVHEYITSGSQIKSENPAQYQDTIKLLWYVTDNKLTIQEVDPQGAIADSHLWPLFSKPLDIGLYAVGDTKMEDWYPAQISSSEFEEHIAPFNVYLDYSSMAVDGPGKFYVFNPLEEIIRTARHTPWGGEGEGWELLR